MTSKWPLIMTSQWIMTLLGMSIVKITMGKAIVRDIHCDITMSNDVVMCTYHGITMHNYIAMNITFFLLCILCFMPNYDFIIGSME